MFVCLLLALLTGCQSQEMVEMREKILLDAEPVDAMGVVAAREQMGEDTAPRELAVIGRIANDEHTTWQTGQASFILQDEAHKPQTVHKHASGAECAFCKQRKKEEAKAKALVKLVDQSRNVLSVDAHSLLRGEGRRNWSS